MDIAYGPLFIVTSWVLSILILKQVPLSLYSVALLLLITLWGSRLGYRIYLKNKGRSEDFRYKAWREEWSKKGTPYFLIRSYLQIFLLQGLIISVVLLPFTLTLLSSPISFFWLILGTIMWGVGFFFESVGDKQLDTFLATKDTKRDSIMKTGLWRFTRHPNYFGESVMWWGLAVIAYGATFSLVPFISPILITFLLLYVSGVPLLEKKWAGNPEWEEYKKKTSVFIPLPPK